MRDKFLAPSPHYDLAGEFDRQICTAFTEAPVARFVGELRHYSVHNRLPIVRGHIQEGERENSIPDSGGQSLQRHPGPLQALQPTRPERVTGRERLARSRRQDPELDQPVDVVGVDPSPLGDLLP